MKTTSQPGKLFETENAIKCVMAHNTHANIAREEEGDMSIVAHDHIVIICSKSGIDHASNPSNFHILEFGSENPS